MWKASSMCSCYSKLKCLIQLNENINIAQYNKLIAFLKGQNDTYEPKKSKVLTMENITKFFDTAPDSEYLLIKVIVIVSLHVGCIRAELVNLAMNDITDTGSILIVNLNETETKKRRTFVVTNNLNGYQLYRQYVSLRPIHVKHTKFFLLYKNGKCSVQSVGMNSFAKFPKVIAKFLELADGDSYTGHCLCRTSATLLADSGADLLTLKRHRGWRANNVAEGYIEDSVQNKIKISNYIFNEPSKPIAKKSKITDDSIKTKTATDVLEAVTYCKDDYPKQNKSNNNIILPGISIE